MLDLVCALVNIDSGGRAHWPEEYVEVSSIVPRRWRPPSCGWIGFLDSRSFPARNGFDLCEHVVKLRA
jgi:hypothetical protein